MSVQALSCAFAVRGLSSSEKLVLLALANFANDEMSCWPSQERLSLDTELSPRTVWAALKGLAEKRVVTRASRKRPDGTRATDVFTLHFTLTVRSEPIAKSAKPTRNSCETHSQNLQEPVAAVATLTTFEPSLEPSKKPSHEPFGFVAWWLAYPRKEGKGAARKAYAAALKKADAEVLLASLDRDWAADRRFIPHPATWLNQERWLDEAQDEPIPPRAQSDDPWPQRLVQWRVAQYWNSDWGPKPGRDGYLGPPVEASARPPPDPQVVEHRSRETHKSDQAA